MYNISIYFASKFENKLLIASLINSIKYKLSNDNKVLTDINSWVYEQTKSSKQDRSIIDFTDINSSDYLVAVFPFENGANAEIGYAIGKNKKVIYLVDQIFYNEEIIPSWGESIPLPCGLLNLPYINTTSDRIQYLKFISSRLRDDDYGCVVFSVDDLLIAIDIYENLKSKKMKDKD